MFLLMTLKYALNPIDASNEYLFARVCFTGVSRRSLDLVQLQDVMAPQGRR